MSFSAPPHDEMAELRRWSSLVIVHSWKNQTSLFVRKMALRRLTKSYIFVSSTYISKMSFRARLHNKSAESRRWLSSIWCNLGKIKYRCFREERRFAAPCCQKSYRKWNIYQRWARENAPGGRYERAKWRGQLETSQLILIITWHKFQPIVIGEGLQSQEKESYCLTGKAWLPRAGRWLSQQLSARVVG